MAHTKAAAATKGNRDSIAKRLGVKVFGGQHVINGNILIRQKGTKFNAGPGTLLGKDYTIYAVKDGVVQYKKRLGDTFVVVE